MADIFPASSHSCDISYRCKTTGFIASAGGDDAIRIFAENVPNGDSDQPSFNLLATANTVEVNGLSWNPAVSGLLASCSDNGSVQLWRVDPSF